MEKSREKNKHPYNVIKEQQQYICIFNYTLYDKGIKQYASLYIVTSNLIWSLGKHAQEKTENGFLLLVDKIKYSESIMVFIN